MTQQRFARYAWAVLIYILPVILIGAFVRATNSGDGCGSHWPLCNGEVVPLSKDVNAVIEYTHRITSGPILGVLVLGLLFGAFRLFPQGHPARLGAFAVFIFTLAEAAMGAILVKFGLVGTNDSMTRAVVMAVHLCLTFLLLGAMALAAWWASGGAPMRWRGQGAVAWALGLGLFATMFLGASGAVTALGDTLFPPKSSLEVISASLSPGAHFLTRLRPWHPLTALSVGLYLVLIAGLVAHLRPSESVRRFGHWVVVLFAIQMGVGFLNVILKAPIFMQMVHLLLADLIWLALVLLCAAATAVDVPHAEAMPAPELEHAVVGRPSWKQYLVLTKPRVISLLLFTTLAAMFAAAGGWPGLELLISVSLGGYMAAGAANCINMALERDLDVQMRRTALRPTVTDQIPSRHALLFGFALGAASFLLLWWRANLLAATLALAGLVFYVVVYTLLLKRRTWQNIVIGGAAGAFPPLVGWAAVTGDLGPLAWYLFAIVFLWTPVHFWALALMMKDDYARAGVPMLPVVHGERATVNQIVLYAVLTAAVSLLPLFHHAVGWVYIVSAVILNALLIARCVKLFGACDRPRALGLYKYSMAYLFLLFLMVAVDRMGIRADQPSASVPAQSVQR